MSELDSTSKDEVIEILAEKLEEYSYENGTEVSLGNGNYRGYSAEEWIEWACNEIQD